MLTPGEMLGWRVAAADSSLDDVDDDEQDEEEVVFLYGDPYADVSAADGDGDGEGGDGGYGGGDGAGAKQSGRGRGRDRRRRRRRGERGGMSSFELEHPFGQDFDGNDDDPSGGQADEFERRTNACLTLAVGTVAVACGALLFDGRAGVRTGRQPGPMLGGRHRSGDDFDNFDDDLGLLADAEDDDDPWWDDKPKRAWPGQPQYATSVAGPEDERQHDEATTRSRDKSGPNRDDLKKKKKKEEEEEEKTKTKSKPATVPEPSYHDESSVSAEGYQKEAAEIEEYERAVEGLSTLLPWDVPYDADDDDNDGDGGKAKHKEKGNKQGTQQQRHHQHHHLPVYWHVPMSAGITFQDVLGRCYGLVEANEIGAALQTNGTNQALRIITAGDGATYVNVDTTTRPGLQHAKELGLASSGLADVVVTPYLYDAAELFRDTEYRGRCLTVLRHPVDRAVAMFHHLRESSSPPPVSSGGDDHRTRREILRNMTIEEYASDPACEENWMVRFLSNRTEGAVTDRHYDLAKEVLGTKCLVGLVDRLPESFRRFERFFGWGRRLADDDADRKRRDCEDELVREGRNVHRHPTLEEGSEVWEMLKKRNGYDFMLYEYAKELFEEQALHTKEDRRGLFSWFHSD